MKRIILASLLICLILIALALYGVWLARQKPRLSLDPHAFGLVLTSPRYRSWLATWADGDNYVFLDKEVWVLHEGKLHKRCWLIPQFHHVDVGAMPK